MGMGILPTYKQGTVIALGSRVPEAASGLCHRADIAGGGTVRGEFGEAAPHVEAAVAIAIMAAVFVE